VKPASQIAQEAGNGPGWYQWCGRSAAPNHYQEPSTIPGEAQNIDSMDHGNDEMDHDEMDHGS